MDDELKRYLDAMMAKINDGQELILNRITSLAKDFQNTKEFWLATRWSHPDAGLI